MTTVNYLMLLLVCFAFSWIDTSPNKEKYDLYDKNLFYVFVVAYAFMLYGIVVFLSNFFDLVLITIKWVL